MSESAAIDARNMSVAEILQHYREWRDNQPKDTDGRLKPLTRDNRDDGLVINNADLSGADLSGQDLQRLLLQFGGSLKGAKLAGSNLADANLLGVDGTDADFTGANLCDALVIGGDFSNARFCSADMQRVVFAPRWALNVDVKGADLREANLAGSAACYDLVLDGANVEGAVLGHRSNPPQQMDGFLA